MNFAWLYNPKTKQTNYFGEASMETSDLYIENFEKTKKFYFQSSEKNELNNIDLISSNEISITKESHINWVNKIKQLIAENQIHKAVAAQKQVFNFEFNILELEVKFEKLITQFPETFVYLFYIENTIWIGASPEVIGILDGNKFSTISLAGTQINQEFTKKEKNEQDIVSEFMQKLLSQNSNKLDSIPTTILQFGSISHLVNEFEMEVTNDFDFEKLIHQIHPSPALSGFPKEKSFKIILENEKLQREFYCGLVSHIVNENKAYSFATIRCAKITKNQVIYYAGGGITDDSNAENEWEETMGKIAILNI